MESRIQDCSRFPHMGETGKSGAIRVLWFFKFQQTKIINLLDMRKRDFVTKQDCRKMPLSCMYYFFSLFILSFPESEVQGFPSMLSTSLFVVMVVGLISVGSSMVFKTQRSVYEIAWRCTKAGWNEDVSALTSGAGPNENEMLEAACTYLRVRPP